MKTSCVLFLLVLVTFSGEMFGQVKKENYRAFNRVVQPYTFDGVSGIAVEAREEAGIVWISGVEFSNGAIEFDVMGEDKPGNSFVGIIFHAVDTLTHDCVYFRPFNFVAEKQLNRDHMVQYVSLPDNDWRKLREEHPGVYEKEIKPSPDPSRWTHARIEVRGKVVKVFVNHSATPSLEVTTLNDRTSGKVGFWAGFQSLGRFANFKITP